MTDKQVSELTAAGALTGAELLHVVQGGNSRQTTLALIAALVDLSSRQPLDSDLTAIAALTTTAYGRALLTLANAAALTAAINAATTSLPGIVEKATDAEVRAATADKYISADHIETASAPVALVDAGPVAVNWDSGIFFTLTVTAARQIDNPTNGQPGTCRYILVQGNNTTDRTITFGANFLGAVPTITDCDDTKWYLLTLFCVTASHFNVSAIRSKG